MRLLLTGAVDGDAVAAAVPYGGFTLTFADADDSVELAADQGRLEGPEEPDADPKGGPAELTLQGRCYGDPAITATVHQLRRHVLKAAVTAHRGRHGRQGSHAVRGHLSGHTTRASRCWSASATLSSRPSGPRRRSRCRRSPTLAGKEPIEAEFLIEEYRAEKAEVELERQHIAGLYACYLGAQRSHLRDTDHDHLYWLQRVTIPDDESSEADEESAEGEPSRPSSAA